MAETFFYVHRKSGEVDFFQTDESKQSIGKRYGNGYDSWGRSWRLVKMDESMLFGTEWAKALRALRSMTRKRHRCFIPG